jgi:hypothetical protein
MVLAIGVNDESLYLGVKDKGLDTRAYNPYGKRESFEIRLD